jgi:hypothetical protein
LKERKDIGMHERRMEKYIMSSYKISTLRPVTSKVVRWAETAAEILKM